jgi:hypothetical protein
MADLARIKFEAVFALKADDLPEPVEIALKNIIERLNSIHVDKSLADILEQCLDTRPVLDYYKNGHVSYVSETRSFIAYRSQVFADNAELPDVVLLKVLDHMLQKEFRILRKADDCWTYAADGFTLYINNF